MFNCFLCPIILTQNIHLLRLQPNQFRRVHANIFNLFFDLEILKKKSFQSESKYISKVILVISWARCRWKIFCEFNFSIIIQRISYLNFLVLSSSIWSNYVYNFPMETFLISVAPYWSSFDSSHAQQMSARCGNVCKRCEIIEEEESLL